MGYQTVPCHENNPRVDIQSLRSNGCNSLEAKIFHFFLLLFIYVLMLFLCILILFIYLFILSYLFMFFFKYPNPKLFHILQFFF